MREIKFRAWDIEEKKMLKQMASLLCYMAEKMPEWRQEVDNSSDKQTCDLCGSQSYIEGRNSALDNCRTLLIEEARKITEV